MRDEYFLLDDEIFELISSLIEDMNNYILPHYHCVIAGPPITSSVFNG